MKKISICFFLLLILFASCARRNLVYFSDLEGQEAYTEQITNRKEIKIQPDDLLSIQVSSLNPESNTLFNRGEVASIQSTNITNANSMAGASPGGYLVDKDGCIDFPVLGRVKLGGMTTGEAKAMLSTALNEYLKEPVINILFLNFTVTVIGEVGRSTILTIPSESINVLEALGMAGDMTPFGKRDNVLVIREEDGMRTLTRLNMNSKQVFQSPYFYLQQNDVVYVEPNNARAIQSNAIRTNISFALSLISVATILFFRLR